MSNEYISIQVYFLSLYLYQKAISMRLSTGFQQLLFKLRKAYCTTIAYTVPVIGNQKSETHLASYLQEFRVMPHMNSIVTPVLFLLRINIIEFYLMLWNLIFWKDKRRLFCLGIIIFMTVIRITRKDIHTLSGITQW